MKPALLFLFLFCSSLCGAQKSVDVNNDDIYGGVRQMLSPAMMLPGT